MRVWGPGCKRYRSDAYGSCEAAINMVLITSPAVCKRKTLPLKLIRANPLFCSFPRTQQAFKKSPWLPPRYVSHSLRLLPSVVNFQPTQSWSSDRIAMQAILKAQGGDQAQSGNCLWAHPKGFLQFCPAKCPPNAQLSTTSFKATISALPPKAALPCNVWMFLGFASGCH